MFRSTSIHDYGKDGDVYIFPGCIAKVLKTLDRNALPGKCRFYKLPNIFTRYPVDSAIHLAYNRHQYFYLFETNNFSLKFFLLSLYYYVKIKNCYHTGHIVQPWLF